MATRQPGRASTTPLFIPLSAAAKVSNAASVAALLAAGYDGPISYECFSPETQAMPDPYSEIRRSFDFIASQLQARAA